jgi:hypothetical protein
MKNANCIKNIMKTKSETEVKSPSKSLNSEENDLKKKEEYSVIISMAGITE